MEAVVKECIRDVLVRWQFYPTVMTTLPFL